MAEEDSKALISISEPVSTLINRISGAVGVLYQPNQIRRKARAEADAKIAAAKADMEVADIQRRAMGRLACEEIKKQENIENTLNFAMPELESTAKPENIEEDWLVNYFDKLKMVSDEDMQRLWARVLTGEAKSQGSFSLRTINLLVQLSKTDADLIHKLGSFVLNEETVYADSKELEAAGLSFRDLIKLSEIGIITGPNNLDNIQVVLHIKKQKNGERRAHILNHDKVLVCHAKNNSIKSITLQERAVTRVGLELLTLAKFTANEKYLLDVANAVRKSCSKIEIADIVSRQGSEIEYTNPTEI